VNIVKEDIFYFQIIDHQNEQHIMDLEKEFDELQVKDYRMKRVGYLSSRFEYFLPRFACELVPT
jgi:hypothetical protein